MGYSPNLLLEAAPPCGINQVWLGDITIIPLAGSRFASLALLMDLYSRRIVGGELAEHMAEPLVLAALWEAIAARQPGPGLIHPTDRGGLEGVDVQPPEEDLAQAALGGAVLAGVAQGVPEGDAVLAAALGDGFEALAVGEDGDDAEGEDGGQGVPAAALAGIRDSGIASPRKIRSMTFPHLVGYSTR
jgi:hypothetical protein